MREVHEQAAGEQNNNSAWRKNFNTHQLFIPSVILGLPERIGDKVLLAIFLCAHLNKTSFEEKNRMNK
jgi:hypothetical protein